jgi:ABC-type glycerol-3-phosphate transport system substrate-binding protein
VTLPAPTPPSLIQAAPDALRGISLQVWHAFTGAAADVFTDQLAQFNTLNEWGIIVYQTPFGEYPSLFETVDSALASAHRPDLVAALPEQIFAWQAKGALADLNFYLYDPNFGLTADEIADIPTTFWTQDTASRERLGVPAQRSARFLFYNQTWARELGFSSPPTSPEEFRTQACAGNAFYRQDATKQNDGYGGWMVNTQPDTVLSWLLAFGGGAVQGGDIHFATPENQDALEFLKGLYDDHCAWISTEPNPYESFARRSALFVTGNLEEAPRLTETLTRLGNNDEWMLLPFPGANGAVLVTSGPSFAMFQSTPEKQLAAWLFVRWLLSVENQAKWAEATGLLPLRFSALDLLGASRADHPQWIEAAGYIPQMQVAPPSAAWRMGQYVLADGVGFIFRTNQPLDKIASILEEMDATVKELNGK